MRARMRVPRNNIGDVISAYRIRYIRVRALLYILSGHVNGHAAAHSKDQTRESQPRTLNCVGYLALERFVS